MPMYASVHTCVCTNIPRHPSNSLQCLCQRGLTEVGELAAAKQHDMNAEPYLLPFCLKYKIHKYMWANKHTNTHL